MPNFSFPPSTLSLSLEQLMSRLSNLLTIIENLSKALSFTRGIKHFFFWLFAMLNILIAAVTLRSCNKLEEAAAS